MFKKIFITMALSLCVGGYSFASTNFSIITESDSKDYIGWGKWRIFSSSTKDKITVNNVDTKNIWFSIESFNLGSSMNFVFGVEDWKTLSQWLYDPAKRHPFKWSYNGIDISGDGRWCNTILGKFYVHEYSVSANGTLEKAAIDFVQYCEWWTAGLYGSIRYNSTISSSCTKAWSCEWVKKTLWISSTTTTNSVSNPSTDMKSLQKMYKKYYKTFTAFMQWEYNITYRKDLRNINKYCKINKLFDTNKDSNNFFLVNACGTKYADVLQAFNEWIIDWMSKSDNNSNEWISAESIMSFRESINELIQIRQTTKLNTKEDIAVSISLLALLRIEYIIHQSVFSS